MRAPFKLFPLTVVLLGALPAAAQDVPRVLFCSGPCFAVDAKGVRTPAPKGTALAPGQRLETGPGAYAQVRMNRDSAIGVGEQARVRFERAAVVLDEGRVRMVGGQALGRPASSPVELRTGDGVLVLNSPDVEVRKSSRAGVAPTPTFVKLNAGVGSLRGVQGEIPLPRQGVHGISAGRISAEAAPLTAITPLTRAPLQTASLTKAPPVMAPMVLSPMLTPSLSPTVLTQPSLTPVISTGDLVLRQPVVDSTTGTTTTLTKIITEPVLTTTSLKSLTLQPITTTKILSPTLTTTTTLLRQ